MTVLAFDSAPNAVRGELTRWFLELKPGVFVGNVNARIRDLLWTRICDGSACRGVVMVYSDRNEQGYSMRMYGEPDRRVIDMEGIQLICRASVPADTSSRPASTSRSCDQTDEYPDRAEDFARVLRTLESSGSDTDISGPT